MDFSHWLLLFCTLLGFYNLGNIWFVQLVVYPLFVKVGVEDYSTYHTFYLRQIPLPVILPGFANFLLPIAGLLSLVVTVALEIPRHDRLEKGGKQEEVIRELIRYNWPRTLEIMGSAFLTLMILMQAFSPTV